MSKFQELYNADIARYGGKPELYIKIFLFLYRKVSTSKLMDAMLPEIENYPPPMWKGKLVKIKYMTQLPTRFPAFAFFCNLPQYIKDPYKRFLENKLREHFDLTGCPVQMFMRQK